MAMREQQERPSPPVISISSMIASPQIQRKRRTHVPRAASHKWSLKKLPVLPPAPAKKKARSRSPRTQEIRESECTPDSPILDSMIDADIYLLKRTSPRMEKQSPPPPPPTVESEPTAAAPSPGNEEGKPAVRRCLHCGSTSSPQWRMGPAGKGTLCNACGVRYRQGGLVPEYRPKESPTFKDSVHSNMRRTVVRIRRLQDDPAPPAPYQRIRAKRNHRKGKGKNQPAQARPAAVPVLQGSTSLQNRQPPLPAAATHPRAGNENLNLPPRPPPALPHAGGDMETERRLLFLPPVLRQSGDEMEQHMPAPPPELPQQTAGNTEMEQQLPPPLALPDAGDEDEPMSPPDPFLFEGPSAPMIIEDNEPVIVIVIDDD